MSERGHVSEEAEVQWVLLDAEDESDIKSTKSTGSASSTKSIQDGLSSSLETSSGGRDADSKSEILTDSAGAANTFAPKHGTQVYFDNRLLRALLVPCAVLGVVLAPLNVWYFGLKSGAATEGGITETGSAKFVVSEDGETNALHSSSSAQVLEDGETNALHSSSSAQVLEDGDTDALHFSSSAQVIVSDDGTAKQAPSLEQSQNAKEHAQEEGPEDVPENEQGDVKEDAQAEAHEAAPQNESPPPSPPPSPPSHHHHHHHHHHHTKNGVGAKSEDKTGGGNGGGSCPGKGKCNCGWTKHGSLCKNGRDDGSECFCRCCCEQRNGICKWNSIGSGTSTAGPGKNGGGKKGGGKKGGGKKGHGKKGGGKNGRGKKGGGCPGKGTCNCGWTNGGAKCGRDDGSECFRRCCCEYLNGKSPQPSPSRQEVVEEEYDDDWQRKVEEEFVLAARVMKERGKKGEGKKGREGNKGGGKKGGGKKGGGKKGGGKKGEGKKGGGCPGKGKCNCGWTKGGSICKTARDDGSECFCRCCCDRRGGSCKWRR